MIKKQQSYIIQRLNSQSYYIIQRDMLQKSYVSNVSFAQAKDFEASIALDMFSQVYFHNKMFFKDFISKEFINMNVFSLPSKN